MHIFYSLLRKYTEPEEHDFHHITAEMSKSFTYDMCSIERACVSFREVVFRMDIVQVTTGAQVECSEMVEGGGGGTF
jgi:hypothetical protein